MQENLQIKSPIKQKILLYLDRKGLSTYRFYKHSGVTRNILQQNNGISEDNLQLFLKYAQDISAEWLLRGEGEMLLTDDIGKPKPSVEFKKSGEIAENEEKAERIEEKLQYYEELLSSKENQIRLLMEVNEMLKDKLRLFENQTDSRTKTA